ncbi:hypothetical protein, partial [Planktothrix sp.]|uniref:hypothetical protein n=1 Tax=Planktothrix sp. TaxID=3088171 RepID=UPI0038D46332
MLDFNLIRSQKNLIFLLSLIGLSTFPFNTLATTETNNSSTYGNSIEFNNSLINIPWQIDSTNRNTKKSVQISDIGLMQNLGVNLLNTNNSSQQPIQ